MDGDRPMADGRDVLESELQELIRKAWATGFSDGCNDDWSEYESELFPKLHELLISYLDRETSDAGAQDEASEARAVGDRVRPESDLRSLGFKPTVFDDITDEFTRQMSLRFYPEGIKPIGHCKLEKKPDGSIHATIKYF